eukprot:scaffold25339_cov56-Isochrysis_galbana.AAC.1
MASISSVSSCGSRAGKLSNSAATPSSNGNLPNGSIDSRRKHPHSPSAPSARAQRGASSLSNSARA